MKKPNDYSITKKKYPGKKIMNDNILMVGEQDYPEKTNTQDHIIPGTRPLET